MTEPQRKPESAEPTPELPDEGADLEPQSQPLAHDEPVEAHTSVPAGSAERGLEPEAYGMGEAKPDGHVDEHAGDEHGHDEPRLGPIDWPAWAYAALGVVVALVVVAAFYVAAY